MSLSNISINTTASLHSTISSVSSSFLNDTSIAPKDQNNNLDLHCKYCNIPCCDKNSLKRHYYTKSHLELMQKLNIDNRRAFKEMCILYKIPRNEPCYFSCPAKNCSYGSTERITVVKHQKISDHSPEEKPRKISCLKISKGKILNIKLSPSKLNQIKISKVETTKSIVIPKKKGRKPLTEEKKALTTRLPKSPKNSKFNFSEIEKSVFEKGPSSKLIALPTKSTKKLRKILPKVPKNCFITPEEVQSMTYLDEKCGNPNKRFKCMICLEGFPNLDLLPNHLIWHSSEFNCEPCKFSCPYKKDYEAHLRTRIHKNKAVKPEKGQASIQMIRRNIQQDKDTLEQLKKIRKDMIKKTRPKKNMEKVQLQKVIAQIDGIQEVRYFTAVKNVMPRKYKRSFYNRSDPKKCGTN